MEQSDKFELYYWNLLTRGEFVRLIFIENEQEWTEPLMEGGFSFEKMKKFREENPFFKAVPVLKHKGFAISQTAEICRYAAKHSGNGSVWPSDEKEQYQCGEILLGILDAMQEGQTAYHAIKLNAHYHDQKKETQPFIDTYYAERVPGWVEFFERRLKLNKGSEYFVGKNLTYADLAVFFMFEGFDAVDDMKDYWVKMRAAGKMEALDAFCQRIRERPKIKKWVEEGRKAKGLKFFRDSCPGN